MRTAGILLAAGASRRFGHGDKLLAHLHGKSIVTYPARALAATRPEFLIAVTRNHAVAALLDNYEIVNPSMDDLLQSDSLRAGLVRAEALGATRVVVVLGDMPFVTSSLIAKIMGKCTTTMPAAATDGFIAKPPACFPAARFSDLMSLSGDRGAGGLFKDLPKSSLATSRRHNELVDVDTPGTLSRLNELSG